MTQNIFNWFHFQTTENIGDIQFTIMQQNTIIPQNSKQCPSTKKWQAKQNLLENDLFYILRVTTRFHSRLEVENETI